MPPWTPPTVADFKAYFTRDFPYAPQTANSNLDYVTDSDIQKAIDQAGIHFNDALGMTGAEATIAYQYLTAFYLVVDLQMAGQGLGSSAVFPVQSQSVGPVSVGYQIPERLLKDPVISYFSQNMYGQKYLSIVLPYAVGNVGIALGTTTP